MARLTQDLDEAVAALSEGRLVAIPTETVYGLAGDATRPEVVRRIFALKRRPADHPLIVHVPSIEGARSLAAHWPEAAERLARAFWPGPLTLIVPKAEMIDPVVTGGQASVGLRVPAHRLARRLLERLGRPLAAPSANRFGHVSPTTAAHVLDEFCDESDLLVLDGGACEVGVESTIVDLTTTRVRILRPGRIRGPEIEALLAVPLEQLLSGAPRASGSLAVHYAPKRPMRCLVTSALAGELLEHAQAGRRVGLIHHSVLEAALPGVSERISLPGDRPELWEHHLYAALRALDRPGIDVIVVETPPQGVEWDAVQDRLRRASATLRPS
ncbi:MAG: L-threonylcarbamoyladenylate synthase [Casimicrobiaceae bacterium]|nr:L-threonylcarbamoyladenylate synthase [Casimicrobiaceae bacterium]